MRTNLDVNADGRQLRFGQDFRVREIKADGTPGRETDWESASGEKENEISFRFEGETRTSLAVSYLFNAGNQLVLRVIEQPGVPAASAPWTLAGKIFVDDVSDLEYVLVDDEGNLTAHRMQVYAALDFPGGYGKLRVTLPDKSETFITGNNKHRSLSAAEYRSGGDLARDLLAFNAVTANTVAGEPEDTPAEIKFYGRWDLHQDSLVFVTRYDTTATGAPAAYLALAGSIKGTNVGLVLEQDGKAALQIGGRYEWNKHTLGWDLKVGYSKSAGLEVCMAGDAVFTGKKGKLTVKGGAVLKKGDQATDLVFDLSLTYAAQDRAIVFTLQGDAGGYEVQLSGDFKIKQGNVKFAITACDRDGKKTVKGMVEFGHFTENTDLKVSLEAVLGRNGLTLKVNLEFRFSWGPHGPVAELP